MHDGNDALMGRPVGISGWNSTWVIKSIGTDFAWKVSMAWNNFGARIIYMIMNSSLNRYWYASSKFTFGPSLKTPRVWFTFPHGNTVGQYTFKYRPTSLETLILGRYSNALTLPSNFGSTHSRFQISWGIRIGTQNYEIMILWSGIRVNLKGLRV